MANRTTSNSLGLAHPCMISTIADGARIVIGNDVGMSGVTICARQEVIIGDETLLGANVMIVDNDFHPIAPENRRYGQVNISTRSVEIADKVFIGANAIILKGVKIGKGSVVGAGSVVVGEVPASVVIAGNPAIIVKRLD